MAKLLNPELIQDEPNVFKLMQVYKSKEEKTVSLAKEDKRSFWLLHTI